MEGIPLATGNHCGAGFQAMAAATEVPRAGRMFRLTFFRGITIAA